MIEKFGKNTALLLIDVQVGVNTLEHWGGPAGRRNNPEAENNMRALLKAFRDNGLPVAYTVHDSREVASPLQLSLDTGNQIEGFKLQDDDIVVYKDVNSGFIGTSLEVQLRRAGVERLVVVGFFTNICVETTIRMAGNMGYDTYMVPDCCATTNRIGHDGTDYDPEVVHALSVASLNGEFCTALELDDAIALCSAEAPGLNRVQGNE